MANKQVLVGALVDGRTREEFCDMAWSLKMTKSELLRKILKDFLSETREGKGCD
jgi:hypothetical protein